MICQDQRPAIVIPGGRSASGSSLAPASLIRHGPRLDPASLSRPARAGTGPLLRRAAAGAGGLRAGTGRLRREDPRSGRARRGIDLPGGDDREPDRRGRRDRRKPCVPGRDAGSGAADIPGGAATPGGLLRRGEAGREDRPGLPPAGRGPAEGRGGAARVREAMEVTGRSRLRRVPSRYQGRLRIAALRYSRGSSSTASVVWSMAYCQSSRKPCSHPLCFSEGPPICS